MTIGQLTVELDSVLVDLWKKLSVSCLEAFYPQLNFGAIILRPANEDIKRYRRASARSPE